MEAVNEANIDLVVEFTGGLEMLFGNKRKHNITIPANDPAGSPANIKSLITYLCDDLMKDSRRELFVVDGSVYLSRSQDSYNRNTDKRHRRPGILVLINDADWELEEEENYKIKKGDSVLFVSTLHGG